MPERGRAFLAEEDLPAGPAVTVLSYAIWQRFFNGDPSIVGGESVLIGSEENTATLAMFTGRSAPQPPRPGTTFGAGCRIGSA